jgi:hypothetical protein
MVKFDTFLTESTLSKVQKTYHIVIKLKLIFEYYKFKVVIY